MAFPLTKFGLLVLLVCTFISENVIFKLEDKSWREKKWINNKVHGSFQYSKIISVHINHQATKDFRVSQSFCSASSWQNNCIFNSRKGGGYAVLHCRVFHIPCCVMSQSRSEWNQEWKKRNFEDICFFQLSNLIFHQGPSGTWSEYAAVKRAAREEL